MNLQDYLKLSPNIAIKAVAILIGLYNIYWLNEHLTSSELSSLNVTSSLVLTILTAIGLGLPMLVQKHYTNNLTQGKSIWSSFLTLRLASFLPGIVIAIVLSQFIPSASIAVVLAIFSYNSIIATNNLYQGIYASSGKIWRYSLTDLVGKLIIVSGLIGWSLITTSVNPLWFYIGISIVGYALSLLLDAIILKKQTPSKGFSTSVIKDNRAVILTLSVSAILISMYDNFQLVILDLMRVESDNINGYENARKLSEQALFLGYTVTPQIASTLKKRLDQTSAKLSMIAKSLGILGSISVAGYLLFILLGPMLLGLIDQDNKYPIQYTILPIIAIYPFVGILTSTINQLLVMLDRERYFLIGVICQLIVSYILYLLLIPRFGAVGAAWAVAIANLIDLFILRLIPLIITLKNASKT